MAAAVEGEVVYSGAVVMVFLGRLNPVGVLISGSIGGWAGVFCFFFFCLFAACVVVVLEVVVVVSGSVVVVAATSARTLAAAYPIWISASHPFEAPE